MSSDHHEKEPGTIELPTPTAWPIISAFGLTLFFAGLVTDISITVVGTVIGLVGAVYWCLDLFPHPKHEPVKLRDPENGPKPIRTAGRVVQMLEAGHVPHRAHIPVTVHPYTAGVIGGAAGGIAMAIAACIAGQILFGSIWYPVNLLAAGGLPSLAIASKQTLMDFNAAGLIVGILSHGTVSIMVGLLYTVLVPMLPRRMEWLWAGVVIPVIWTAVIFFTLGLINPGAERSDLLAGFRGLPSRLRSRVRIHCLSIRKSGNHAKLVVGPEAGRGSAASCEEEKNS